MRRIASTMLLMGMLTACGSKSSQETPEPASTRAPETIVEMRPAPSTVQAGTTSSTGSAATGTEASTVTRGVKTDAAAVTGVMLANANVPLEQVEAYALRNGITLTADQMTAKREMQRRREGMPKLVGGSEYITVDPDRDAVRDPALERRTPTPADQTSPQGDTPT